MKHRRKIISVFGTRPEIIKLAPVIRALQSSRDVEVVNIASSQHADLLYPLASFFNIKIDRDLKVMQPDQTPNQVCSRVLSALESVLASEASSLLLVQGDTSTAMASALAAFHTKLPVAHVEAGLRSGSRQSPYPEEMNRQLISRLATYHFAPTPGNRDTLLAEGVDLEKIFVTGNPIVDSLHSILRRGKSSPPLRELLEQTKQFKRLVLTTHRRESFGTIMIDNLSVLRNFVDTHQDVALLFPVHPNPTVCKAAHEILDNHPRIKLLNALTYQDFIHLLLHAWLVVSDSGGVQEEIPSLGKPLLILRDNTERPEVLQSGLAKLVGGRPETLASMLDEAYSDETWTKGVEKVTNPFGRGDSGKHIARIIVEIISPDRTRRSRFRTNVLNTHDAPALYEY